MVAVTVAALPAEAAEGVVVGRAAVQVAAALAVVVRVAPVEQGRRARGARRGEPVAQAAPVVPQ
jgi:hypothetical protein